MKVLALLVWGLCVDLQKPGMVEHSCNPSLSVREVEERGRFLRFAEKGSERDWLKKEKVNGALIMIIEVALWPPHKHTHKSIYTHMNMCELL